MKKLASFYLASLFLAATAIGQTYVNFADSGSPASLSAFFYIDGAATNYITAPTSKSLSDASSASFDGSAAGSPGVFPLNFSVYDDGYATTNTLGYQASFSITNNTGSDQPVSTDSLEFGVSGLYAIDAGLNLTPTFSIVSGDTLITSQLITTYNAGTGTFTFKNDQGFTITNGTTLTFTGNFNTSAVPEPSTYAAIFGLAALGLALWQRRRKEAVS